MKPRVAIIGAGVVGILSAYSLAKRGAKVTVIERNPAAAHGCSQANAGILAIGHASAWAKPAAVRSILRAVVGIEPGVQVTQLIDPTLWRWGAQFLSHCSNKAHLINTKKLQNLAMMSRDTTKVVEAELELAGLLRHEGGLYLFQNTDQFQNYVASLALQTEVVKNQMHVLDHDALIRLEPSLANIANKLAGGVFSPLDSVGDCHLFTQKVAEVLVQKFDVELRFENVVNGFRQRQQNITTVETDCGSLKVDAVLLATGTQTPQLTRQLGFSPAIYPVKGYSGTWPINDHTRIPRLPFVDETELLAVASYGDSLRVTAIAEFAGQHDYSLPESRINLLQNYVLQNFGNAVTQEAARFWCGQRPTTPAGPPFLGRVRQFKNLWINAGHGQLGWTMAAGSGELIAQAMNGENMNLLDFSCAAHWLDTQPNAPPF